MEKNSYKITVNNVQKVITILAGELTSTEAAERFIKEYQAKANSVKSSDYTLDIDCREMKVLTPSLVESLQPAFRLYKESGFMNVRFLVSNSAVKKMQFMRIARAVGLKAEFVE